MADVKIVDIDTSQWNIKDQEARNRIATLEEKTTVKVTVKINEINIKLNIVEINAEKFLQLHCDGLFWQGTVGEVIASFTQDFGLNNTIRCFSGLSYRDGSGRGVATLDITTNGQIKIYPLATNITEGFFKESYIFCDTFIKII